jgi:hypothetical protein
VLFCKDLLILTIEFSEIITGYGRLIHKQMKKMGFEHYGLQTVFGFTDSIFSRHGNASVATHNITKQTLQTNTLFILLEIVSMIKHKD